MASLQQSHPLSPPSIFQAYLLPSLPFGRRRRRRTQPTGGPCEDVPPLSTSVSSSSSAEIISSPSTPPDYEENYLHGHNSHISCMRCHADIALTSQIISKGFTGRHGRALLLAGTPSALSSAPATPSCTSSSGIGLPNTHTHKPVPRHLVTGMHTVCDISCAHCGTVLGWKYVNAEEESQKYKVGKFILETRRVITGSCWENWDGYDSEGDDSDCIPEFDGLALEIDGLSGKKKTVRPEIRTKDEDIQFDSQDEDECEDLFQGIWTPQLAKRRRARKTLRTS